jgi:hypothetical protein
MPHDLIVTKGSIDYIKNLNFPTEIIDPLSDIEVW